MVLEIGDLRDELGMDLLATIEEVIRRCQHKRHPYYLLVYSDYGLDVFPSDPKGQPPPGTYMKVDGKTVIKTKILILDMKPNFNKNLEAALRGEIKVLGMMAYKVDNIKGKLTRLWVLPQNIPDHPGLVQEERVIEEVLDSARDIGKLIQ